MNNLEFEKHIYDNHSLGKEWLRSIYDKSMGSPLMSQEDVKYAIIALELMIDNQDRLLQALVAHVLETTKPKKTFIQKILRK